MPLEHDAQCLDQEKRLALFDKQLAVLTQQLTPIVSDLDAIVSRVQLLVDQMHDQTTKQGVMQITLDYVKAKVDAIQRWGALIAGGIIVAFIGAVVAFIVRGGLKP